MRRPLLALVLVAVCSLAGPCLAAAPPQAGQVLGEASARAARGSKNVLLIFHASWCGWCKRMEAFTAAPAAREVLGRHFEVVWLDVLERGARKSLENPGANAVLGKLGGQGSGLPFYAVLDPSGKVLGTSIVPSTGRNTGYPQASGEIEHFLGTLKTGAPGLTPAELQALRKAFGPSRQ